MAPRAAAAASQVPSASSAVVALAVPADTPFPQCSGVLVATGEAAAGQGDHLVVAQVGCSRGTRSCCGCRSGGSVTPDLATSTSDEELLAWALADLATVFGVSVEPIDVRVQRWIDAMPQYGPGHADLVAEVRAGLPPGLSVAGSYLDGIGVPACIAAAGRAIETLSAEVAR